MLPVRCCPEPVDGRPRERPDGPGAERPMDRASGMENAREPSVLGCSAESARFPPRCGRRKRRPHGPQVSLLLISIHDDRNRQKWSTPSGKSS